EGAVGFEPGGCGRTLIENMQRRVGKQRQHHRRVDGRAMQDHIDDGGLALAGDRDLAVVQPVEHLQGRIKQALLERDSVPYNRIKGGREPERDQDSQDRNAKKHSNSSGSTPPLPSAVLNATSGDRLAETIAFLAKMEAVCGLGSILASGR